MEPSCAPRASRGINRPPFSGGQPIWAAKRAAFASDVVILKGAADTPTRGSSEKKNLFVILGWKAGSLKYIYSHDSLPAD